MMEASSIQFLIGGAQTNLENRILSTSESAAVSTIKNPYEGLKPYKEIPLEFRDMIVSTIKNPYEGLKLISNSSAISLIEIVSTIKNPYEGLKLSRSDFGRLLR